MNTTPLVSVIMCNYNNAPWVIEALNSVATQTYKNIEIIVLDDCSKDNSPSLIEEWLKTYTGTFKFIRHERNMGICITANDGIAASSGKYICFLATDDIMLPEKTAEQAALLEQAGQDVGMVYSDARLIQDDGRPIYGNFIQRYRQDFIWPPSGWIFDDIIKGNYIPGMATLIRKSVIDAIGSFDPTLSYEDFDMWLRIAEKYQIIFQNKQTVKYRIRKGSLMHSSKNFNPSQVRIFAKFIDHATARRALFDIAVASYIVRDKESILQLRSLNEVIPGISTILKLWDVKFPHFIGKRIVARLKYKDLSNSVNVLT
ncbi:glycosyltransferase [Taibaiella soli]|nr:glycosyltransferase [Taibaiella soli]